MATFSPRCAMLVGIIAASTNSFADNLTNEQRKEICVEYTKQTLASMKSESPRQYRSMDSCTIGIDGIPTMHFHIDYKPHPSGDRGKLLSEIYGANETALQVNCIHLSDGLEIFNIRTSFYYQEQFITSTNLSRSRCKELKSQNKISIDGKPKLTQEATDMIKTLAYVEGVGIDAYLQLIIDGAKDKLGSVVNNEMTLTYAKSEKNKLSYGYKFIAVLKNQVGPVGIKTFMEQKVSETCNIGVLKMLISMYGIQVDHEYLDKNAELVSKMQVNRESCRAIW